MNNLLMGSKSYQVDWLFVIKNCEDFGPIKFSVPRTVILMIVIVGSPEMFHGNQRNSA
jgi:hypothetical protein